MSSDPRDPYREWSVADRSNAGRDPDQRDGCRRYDEDWESSDRAYAQWRCGGDYSDPEPDGRFH
jgi:hypothetical protein